MQGQTFFTIFPEAQRESSVLKIRKQKYKIIRLSKQHTRAQQERGRGEGLGCAGAPPGPRPHPTLSGGASPAPGFWGSGLTAGTSSTQAVSPRPGPSCFSCWAVRMHCINAFAVPPQEADRWHRRYSSHLNWLTHYFQTLDIHTNPVPPRKIF